jgi:hypothetical protein
MSVDSDITLLISPKTDSDLRKLTSINIGDGNNHPVVLIDNLNNVELKNIQKIVRQGYHLSSSDAPSLDSFNLDQEEINLFMSNPSEWIYLFDLAGIQNLSFEAPVTLTEQATRSLLDSNISLIPEQSIKSLLSTSSVPVDFFNHVSELITTKNLDAIEFINSINNPQKFSLGNDIEVFSKWALDTSLDISFKNFSILIPNYLLDVQDLPWIEIVENHLQVNIVGTYDSDIQLIYGY